MTSTGNRFRIDLDLHELKMNLCGFQLLLGLRTLVVEGQAFEQPAPYLLLSGQLCAATLQLFNAYSGTSSGIMMDYFVFPSFSLSMQTIDGSRCYIDATHGFVPPKTTNMRLTAIN